MSKFGEALRTPLPGEGWLILIWAVGVCLYYLVS